MNIVSTAYVSTKVGEFIEPEYMRIAALYWGRRAADIVGHDIQDMVDNLAYCTAGHTMVIETGPGRPVIICTTMPDQFRVDISAHGIDGTIFVASPYPAREAGRAIYEYLMRELNPSDAEIKVTTRYHNGERRINYYKLFEDKVLTSIG